MWCSETPMGPVPCMTLRHLWDRSHSSHGTSKYDVMSGCFTKKSLNAANENIQKRFDVFVPRSCVIVFRQLLNNCRGSNIIQNMANYLAADEFWGYMSGKLSGNKGNWSFQSPTQFFLIFIVILNIFWALI